MLAGHDILCFANDWSGDPLSKKHIMLRLARGNRVLWVNSTGNRAPQATVADLRRAAAKVRDFARGMRPVGGGIHVYPPLFVPLFGSGAARRVNRALLRSGLARNCRRLGFEAPITWTFLPSSADVVGTLGERLVVYHCVDEFSEFTGTHREAVLAMERRLLAAADVVIVSSSRLLAAKRPYNPATHLVMHGVEVEHFRRACRPETAVAPELAALPRPVIGFVGLVADWVDLELVARVARARPRWSLVLIGKLATDPSPVAGLGNVHLLGWRSYDLLPAYCKGFDAAILPFAINELTLASNPLKLREYLAAGLPVVASALPEAERLAPLVRVGRDPDDFLRRLDELVESGETGPREERSAAMDGETWDHKVADLAAIVAGALAERDRRPAAIRERAHP